MRAMRFQMLIVKNIGRAKKLLMSIILLTVLLPSFAFTQDPDCTGIERWPTMMALGELKDASITDMYKLDFPKTKTIRLASEKIGDDLYRQIHFVTFTEESGKIIEVITMNDVSSEECSMSDVRVFVVSQDLGAKIGDDGEWTRKGRP